MSTPPILHHGAVSGRALNDQPSASEGHVLSRAAPFREQLVDIRYLVEGRGLGDGHAELPAREQVKDGPY